MQDSQLFRGNQSMSNTKCGNWKTTISISTHSNFRVVHPRENAGNVVQVIICIISNEMWNLATTFNAFIF